MPADQQTLEAVAKRVFDAEKTGNPMAPFSDADNAMSFDEAYKAQDQYVALHEERGARVVGFKIGMIGKKSQKLFEIDEPIYGRLFDKTRYESGAKVAMNKFTKPKLETEIGVRLGRDLEGPEVTRENVLEAIDGVFGAFELVDCRTKDWKAKGRQVICDNCVQAGFVQGAIMPYNGELDFTRIKCALAHNGEVVADTESGKVMEHPLDSLVWLANKRASFGAAVPAGSLILTGSLTGLTPFKSGDTFEASYSALEDISVSFK